MARNVVICCDGTNNEFGRENTSVVRLIQALDRRPGLQRLYYDPGVGTLPEPGAWTRAGKWLSKGFGLAFGGGIFWKVQQAYTYLMDFWEPGDRVYLFGFSRGAYTARVLAAVLHEFGLLPRGNYNLVAYVMRRFKALPSAGDDSSGDLIQKYFAVNAEFRETFARVATEVGEERRFPVHFLGLFDTVSSVGWAWDPKAYPFTARNPSVHVIRHAISIDERRWFFRQNRIRQADAGQSVKEMWFPGVHSDVGGGYPEKDGGLWRDAFEWMITEARHAELLFDESRLAVVRSRQPPPERPWLDPQHESLTRGWWPLELYPKRPWRGADRPRKVEIGLGRHRTIRAGERIHQCVLLRLRGKPDYRPPNLSEKFVKHVCSLPDVPESLLYEE